MSFASGCNAGSMHRVIFNRNFGSSVLVFDSFESVVFVSHFLSIGKVGDAMGVVDVRGVLLCELVSNDNGDASFAGVSFLSLSLIDCDRANVLSSLATVLCSSSISVDMLSGSGNEKRKTFNEHYSRYFLALLHNVVLKHLWLP